MTRLTNAELVRIQDLNSGLLRWLRKYEDDALGLVKAVANDVYAKQEHDRLLRQVRTLRKSVHAFANDLDYSGTLIDDVPPDPGSGV